MFFNNIRFSIIWCIINIYCSIRICTSITSIFIKRILTNVFSNVVTNFFTKFLIIFKVIQPHLMETFSSSYNNLLIFLFYIKFSHLTTVKILCYSVNIIRYLFTYFSSFIILPCHFKKLIPHYFCKFNNIIHAGKPIFNNYR
ncbi:unknown [Eubacterium sp. CAG:192]|nr:unknown [Eubacterium sp. CAG:192]